VTNLTGSSVLNTKRIRDLTEDGECAPKRPGSDVMIVCTKLSAFVG
jgi:hypothetical protein